MKTKILKRILAAIIAFSAVIGTSGLSSAGKRMPRKNEQSQSGKKSGHDSDTSSVESEEGEEGEESEEGYSMCASFSDDEELDYEEKNYEYSLYLEKKILSGEDLCKELRDEKKGRNLKKNRRALRDEKKGRNLKKNRRVLKENRRAEDQIFEFQNLLQKAAIKSNLSAIIEKLDHFSQNKKVLADVAGALSSFAREGIFRELNEEQVDRLITILDRCAPADSNSEENSVSLLTNLIDHDFLLMCTDKQAIEISNVLMKYFNFKDTVNGEVLDIVFSSLQSALDKYKRCDKTDAQSKIKIMIGNFIDLMLKRQNDEACRKSNIANVISVLSDKCLINGLSDDTILNIIRFFESCANDSEAEKYVVLAMRSLCTKRCLNCFEDKLDTLQVLVKILKECFRLECLVREKEDPKYVYLKPATYESVRTINAFLGIYNDSYDLKKHGLEQNPESENSQNFLNQLIEGSFFKNLTGEGKKELKELLIAYSL